MNGLVVNELQESEMILTDKNYFNHIYNFF